MGLRHSSALGRGYGPGAWRMLHGLVPQTAANHLRKSEREGIGYIKMFHCLFFSREWMCSCSVNIQVSLSYAVGAENKREIHSAFGFHNLGRPPKQEHVSVLFFVLRQNPSSLV